MKRQLTKKEKEVTEKNHEKNVKKLKSMKDRLAYNEALMNKENYLRTFQNKWADYLQTRKDEENDEIIKNNQIEIKEQKIIVNSTQDQLDNGVEVKENPGVG